MRTPENIEALAALNPDYMGFIFWAPSSRFVNKITPLLPNKIKKTGVFVDATIDYIETIIKEHKLQAVQLHGKEAPEFCAYIKTLDVEVIKAFSMKEAFDFKSLEPYEIACDFYLFDTKGELPGGNGYGFDWSILKNYPSVKPFFLSGGIGKEEVSQILELRNTDLPLYAIDVNSKFESAPGVKKIDELEQFKNELYEL
ncbi:MAG: phosphoribosylanthranilate isomerase [Flavobacteriaceae bacterium]|nr:phosphoribosylanthranilate isomerase [Flavobacteriaceae bacterium]MDO7581652.1 phosphoribosylanthranilate isomerase [Flavobacteriaceae bacterium]MDO7599803.1 phosphoribosylanthranilate isomerase [Flavobacteriaceae bacterium]MDO7602337.1 phosphoribosylanthranilate isomerase [Flavobacteriaceae bacterium]MDO7615574.1 phosphoribosylanthranilate isomerase [Flavobacteriaceae bacterium]